MLYLLVAILLIVVLIFGVSSGMQSYATAQQAQAQIETAKVAQISSWGNLITILMLALVIVVVLLLILAAVYLFFLRPKLRLNARVSTPRATGISEPNVSDPTQALGQLVQLEALKLLHSMNATSRPQNFLSAPNEEQPIEDDLPWLGR